MVKLRTRQKKDTVRESSDEGFETEYRRDVSSYDSESTSGSSITFSSANTADSRISPDIATYSSYDIYRKGGRSNETLFNLFYSFPERSSVVNNVFFLLMLTEFT